MIKELKVKIEKLEKTVNEYEKNLKHKRGKTSMIEREREEEKRLEREIRYDEERYDAS